MSHETDDYRKAQDARDAAYRRDYAAWLASLSPEDLAFAKANGLDQPACDGGGYGSNFSERDLAESPLAAVFSHPSDSIEPACDQPGYQAQHTDAEWVWDAVRRLLGELLIQKNARLTLECMAIVSGVAFLGDSMSEVGRRYGLSRAAVSKRCIELARKVGVPPSRAMRSLTACAAYAQARKESLRRNES